MKEKDINKNNMYCYLVVFAVEYLSGAVGNGTGVYFSKDPAKSNEWIKDMSVAIKEGELSNIGPAKDVMITNWKRLKDDESWDVTEKEDKDLII